jgi:hypothetical protein
LNLLNQVAGIVFQKRRRATKNEAKWRAPVAGLTSFEPKIFERAENERRAVAGASTVVLAADCLRLVAAIAATAAELAQAKQDDDDRNGNPHGFVTNHIEVDQQRHHANQDDEHAGHFGAEAAAFFGFTALFFVGRFHGLLLLVCGLN